MRKTADDEQRNCPKHVEFYSKNKFEKLVHLVGLNVRICHDTRSPERQKTHAVFGTVCTRGYAKLKKTRNCQDCGLHQRFLAFLHSHIKSHLCLEDRYPASLFLSCIFGTSKRKVAPQ